MFHGQRLSNTSTQQERHFLTHVPSSSLVVSRLRSSSVSTILILLHVCGLHSPRLFDGDGDDESSHDDELDFVKVGAAGSFGAEHAQGGKEEDGEDAGDGERDELEDPEGGHEEAAVGHPAGVRFGGVVPAEGDGRKEERNQNDHHRPPLTEQEGTKRRRRRR